MCDNQSGRRRWDTHDQSCVVPRRVRGLAFVTYDIAEMLKNATHFLLIMDSPGGGGYTTSQLAFLESSRRADVKL